MQEVTFSRERSAAPPQSSSAEALSIEDVDRWHVDFCDHARTALGHSPASIRGYRFGYANFRKFLADPDHEQGATVRDRLCAIAAWVQWNRRRGLSEVATNTYWRQVRTFFRYLDAVRGIPNPFSGLKAPRLPDLVPKARSADECRRLLSAARNYPWATEFERARAQAIFGVLIYAGLRRSEVVSLEFADVDLAGETIRVLRGKGRYGGKDRVAVIPPELRVLLERYVRARQRCGYAGSQFFVSTQTGASLSDAQLKRTFLAVCRAAGIRASMHSLRHSYVSLLLSSGVPLHVVKELAGHTDITTTANYLRVWDSEKHDQVRKLRLLR